MKQTSKYYLQHSGILGMKWGKRNGPPYPLKYEDLSEEERDNAKKKAVRAGNITEANNNIDFFDDRELKQLKDRFELNQKVRSLAEDYVDTGSKKVDRIMKKVGQATTWTETGIKAYDTGAKIHNAFAKDGKKWTIINQGGKKKKGGGGDNDD